jgi:hypothetical protein
VTSKLRLKIGEVEIDFEGTEEFLKQELPQLLKTAMELHEAAGMRAKPDPTKTRKSGATATIDVSLTTASIAARLEASSGPDLLKAAAAQLCICSKKGSFTRAELLTQMQSASGYYKKSYSNNLSRYLTTAMTDGLITESAKNVYALSAASKQEVEQLLADSRTA